MRGLLASPLGFLIGLSLGALGGGGSILAVPVLVYVAGQDPSAATTTSLLVVGSAAAVGLRDHHRAARVDWRTGTTFGATGIAGSLVGSAINSRLDGDVLLLAFSGLVMVAAWRMLTGCPSCTRVGEEEALADGAEPRRMSSLGRLPTLVLAGTAVGFLTGLFGVGGGFVIVPALTLLLGLNMPRAIGTSLLVIVINTIVAMAARLGATSIDWAVTLPFAVASAVGVVSGARIADRLDPKKTLGYFAALLVGVGLYTAIRAGLALAG